MSATEGTTIGANDVLVVNETVGALAAPTTRQNGISVLYPDLLGNTIFLGSWLAIMDAAAKAAIRQGKTIKEAQDALAVAMGAQWEQGTK
jgi:hypothetical protein